MAYSENLASLQQWSFRPSFADSWMISDAFSRETETLTKALQQSLSRDSETLTADTNNAQFNHLVKPEPAPTASGSDPETTSKRRNSIANGKITKRKSRATKRSPVTFIAADPTNFRQMVQQVTGIRFGNEHVPVTPIIKPEPKRPGDLFNNYSLPTLDTSAFLLDQQHQQQQQQQQQQQSQIVGPTGISQAHVSFATVAEDGVGLDFDFQNFPTLESWGVM
ncbi:VQ [Macleaya cordata]|uniref:VQ n=1 Tax=Macleaya cordata TaxID=56857 RepID=A0A200QTQ3_MACCD|nr:VQ [Macleaya cordata]